MSLKLIICIVIITLINTYSIIGQPDVRPEYILKERLIQFEKHSELCDTITIYERGKNQIKVIENRDRFYSIANGSHEMAYNKNTPRIQFFDNSLVYNSVHLNTFGSVITQINLSSESYRTPFTYTYAGWQENGHMIFDFHDNEIVLHCANFLAINKKEPSRIYPTSIKGLDFIISANLDSCINESYMPKPGTYLSRSGYLVEAFNNRKTLDVNKITLTKDSLSPHKLLTECWYDFHIDKKGVTHAFVYLRGELIYLNQTDPSHNQLAPTSWKEIFSIPASDDIGPFTSVTVKGKQYLFTQDGTILKNTGKTMTEIGKLPGDLRNISVVWNKEKDKMWYITKEEFEAYKAGNTEIISQLNEIQLNGKSAK